jgi:hypothetical protein
MSSKTKEKKGIYIDDVKTIENISGPISMYLLTSPKLPTILLLGDHHFSYRNMCKKDVPNSYVIYDQKFIDLFDFEGVHYFLEDKYYNFKYQVRKKKLEYLIHSDNDTNKSTTNKSTTNKSTTNKHLGEEKYRGPLHSLSERANPCYFGDTEDDCKSKNIRWHYIDVRFFDDIVSDPFLYVLNLLDTNVLEPLLMSKQKTKTPLYDFTKFLNMSEFTYEFEDLNWLIEYLSKYKSFVECIVNSPLIQKQQIHSPIKLLDKLQTYYEKLELRIYKENGIKNYGHFLMYITKFVNDYNEFMHNPLHHKNDLGNFYREFWKEPPGLDKYILYHVLVQLKCYLVDIYGIQRSFNYAYDSKLNIFYMGDDHIYDMLHFLVDEIQLYSIEYRHDSIYYEDKYKLLDWIPEYKLDIKELNKNPNVIDFLKDHPEKINWKYLNMNPNGYNLLEKNNRLKFNTICRTPTKNALQLVIKNIGNMIEKDWSILSGNPAAIQLLTANQKKIDWSELSANPNAIKLLRDNKENIDWSKLSSNPKAISLLEKNEIDWTKLSGNPNAIELLKANKKKIDWVELSGNPNAIGLLKANQKRINWFKLSGNPNAINLLKKNQHKINWNSLSSNPKAIELLKNNQEQINWKELSVNPSIFKKYKIETPIDYEKDEPNRCLHINKYIPIYKQKRVD